MKKIVTLLLASMIFGSAPLMAAEAVDTEASPLPKVLTDLGITPQDLNDVDRAVIDQPTKEEAGILRRRRRDCPRGYHLEAYRIRIGRFVIVRYQCVRNHHHHDIQQSEQNLE